MRNPSGGFLQTIVAPMFGATGLIAAFVLSAANFRSLVGTNNQFVANMPWLLGAVVIVGLLAGLWLRQGRQRGRHHASIGLDIWSGPPPTAPAATRTGTARRWRRAGGHRHQIGR